MSKLPFPSARAFFQKNLLDWYDPEARPMPWKEERDPYLVWLSEIILQQTRVAQGMPYFERFRARYPDIKALAAAPEDEIMKMWEGLGYYRRARHLLQAARQVVEDSGGDFPNTYKDIRALKGVGPYTAAAIASMAFGLPHAVVDGNVYRVLARFFGIKTPLDSAEGKKEFQALADHLLDMDDPGRYNQALMEFGSSICRPRSPVCPDCPLARACVANAMGVQQSLPVKRPAPEKKERYFHYLVMRYQGRYYLHKRTKADIWQNLYEFPLVEWPEDGLAPEALIRSEKAGEWIGHEDFSLRAYTGPERQTLSHQLVYATFYEIDLFSPPTDRAGRLLEVGPEQLARHAFPRLIDWYLRDKSLSLKVR